MIWQAWKEIADALGIATGEFKGTGQEVDAIGIILKGFKIVLDGVIIAIKLMARVMRAVADAVQAVRSAIDLVVDGFNKMKEVAADVEESLPDWLVPGSPTPLELGLRGIAAAAKSLPSLGLPAMPGGLGGAGLATGGGGGGAIVINLTYAPAVSLADRYEAESTLAPFIAAAVRRELGLRG
jgi:hypothetical protein